MNSITIFWTALWELHFVHPWLLLVLSLALLALVPLWKRLRRGVANTFVHGHRIRSVGWPGVLCMLLLIGMWLAFAGAAAEPELAQTVYQDSYQAREFQILIDKSGSMFSWDVDDATMAKIVKEWEQQVYEKQLAARDKFPALYPIPPKKPDDAGKGNEGKLTRFALARYAAYLFVNSRLEAGEQARKAGKQSDRVGIGTFDDEVYPTYPLTSSLNIVSRKIEQLLSVTSGGGTNFDGPRPDEGEMRVGAFQYCIDHFRKWGKPNVKTRVMIFISDGDAGVSDSRHQQLVRQMKAEGLNIHVYALVCGPKSQLTNSSTESMRKLIAAVNPNDPAHPEFQKAVIWAGDGEAMRQAFDTINRLEKSTVEGEPVEKYRPVRHEFILAGCIFGILFTLSCAAFRENF